MLPLTKALAGKHIIVNISPECLGAKHRLTALGIFTGDEIEITKPAPGPVIFTKGGTRIGIGQGIAMHILVRPCNTTQEKNNNASFRKTR